MKSSMISTAVLLVSALVVAEAGYRQAGYSPEHQPEQHTYSESSGRSLGHYGGGSHCTGYNCNGDANRASHPYGPYHSYAVRPALYGGYGLYTYRGYARHSPAPHHPAAAHYRGVRSACYGGNCGGAGHRSHGGGGKHYGMRPVNVIVLAPAHSGHYGKAPARYQMGSRGHSPKSYKSNHRANYRQQAGHYRQRHPKQNRYNSQAGYGSGHKSAGRYGHQNGGYGKANGAGHYRHQSAGYKGANRGHASSGGY